MTVRERPFPDPTILLHPNIPKPLHLVNPRTILGGAWWEKTRKESYVKYEGNEFRCHACGIEKYDAPYRSWLEAHEMYKIDYTTGRVEFTDVVALCHSCHNYIHRGRLQSLLAKGEISQAFYLDLSIHGDRILTAAGIPLDVNAQLVNLLGGLGLMCNWEDYHMVVNGVRYERRFKDFEEWKSYWEAK